MSQAEGAARAKGKGPEVTLCSGLYSAASSVTGRAGEMRSRFCGAWRLWLGLPGRGEEVPSGSGTLGEPRRGQRRSGAAGAAVALGPRAPAGCQPPCDPEFGILGAEPSGSFHDEEVL